MNRTVDDFPQGQYLIVLSPEQIAQLVNAEVAVATTDQYCRIAPADPNVLELWLTSETASGAKYILYVVAKPADCVPYTVSAVYEDNEQAYVQTVLAANQSDAIDTAQRIAYASSQGYEVEYDGSQMLDPYDIEANLGYGEDAHPVSVRNANSYPTELAYVVALFVTSEAFQRLDSRHQEHPVTQLYRLTAVLATTYFNELPREQATGLTNEEIWAAADRILDGADEEARKY